MPLLSALHSISHTHIYMHAHPPTMFSCLPFFFSYPLCSVAIGIGFYGNSEANDGMYQLTSSLLTANYTLASIDLLVSAAPRK